MLKFKFKENIYKIGFVPLVIGIMLFWNWVGRPLWTKFWKSFNATADVEQIQDMSEFQYKE